MKPAAYRSTDLLAAGLLLGYHAAVHERWSREGRFAANLVAAGTAVGIGAATGLTTDEMGLSSRKAGPGLVCGAVVAAPVAAAIVGAANIPHAHRLFADERAGALSRRDAAFEILVRIPFETGLAEEVLFRGVHLGLTRRLHATPWAVTRTSVAFGLWHVLPAFASLRRTAAGAALADSPARRASAVAATVAATALAGAFFAALRLRSGSVLAPVIVHTVLNATALACAITHDLEPSIEGAT
jgi:membrane protease YdiL (CAAX protease family)